MKFGPVSCTQPKWILIKQKQAAWWIGAFKVHLQSFMYCVISMFNAWYPDFYFREWNKYCFITFLVYMSNMLKSCSIHCWPNVVSYNKIRHLAHFSILTNINAIQKIVKDCHINRSYVDGDSLVGSTPAYNAITLRVTRVQVLDLSWSRPLSRFLSTLYYPIIVKAKITNKWIDYMTPNGWGLAGYQFLSLSKKKKLDKNVCQDKL